MEDKNQNPMCTQTTTKQIVTKVCTKYNEGNGTKTETYKCKDVLRTCNRMMTKRDEELLGKNEKMKKIKANLEVVVDIKKYEKIYGGLNENKIERNKFIYNYSKKLKKNKDYRYDKSEKDKLINKIYGDEDEITKQILSDSYNMHESESNRSLRICACELRKHLSKCLPNYIHIPILTQEISKFEI